jgi:hypothetical protein
MYKPVGIFLGDQVTYSKRFFQSKDRDFLFFPAASLLLSCMPYRIAARKQQGST